MVNAVKHPLQVRPVAAAKASSFRPCTMRSYTGRMSAGSPDDGVYLFSYFVGNGEDGLHLATSEDGLKWSALRGGGSLLQPVVGENEVPSTFC